LTKESEYGIIKGLEANMAVNLKEDIKPISYIKTNKLRPFVNTLSSAV